MKSERERRLLDTQDACPANQVRPDLIPGPETTASLRSPDFARISAAGPRVLSIAFFLLLVTILVGCSGPAKHATPHTRRFDFQKDTFAFANELVWQYGYDKDGRWTSHRRESNPDYSHHCFVLARSAAQFFENTRFAPDLPAADNATYRRLIHQVVDSNLRKQSAEHEKIILPGYPDLRTFSQAHEQSLKAECGPFLQSYFQRGNWRMIFPFSRKHQAATADQLLGRLANHHVVVVHVVRFPQLSINHAVVMFDAKPIGIGTLFLAYDPNDPAQPLRIIYHRATRTFLMDPTGYFPGGRVDVYQIYHRWNY